MSYFAQGPQQNLHEFAFSHARAEQSLMKQIPRDGLK